MSTTAAHNRPTTRAGRKAFHQKRLAEKARRNEEQEPKEDQESEEEDQVVDELVPDPAVAKEFHISLMGLHRWTNDPTLDFPPKILIRNRNYRSRRLLEKFKKRMVRRGISNSNLPPVQHKREEA